MEQAEGRRLRRCAIKIASHAPWSLSQSKSHCVIFQSSACLRPVFLWVQQSSLCAHLHPLAPGQQSSVDREAIWCFFLIFDQITGANIGLNQVPPGFPFAHTRLHMDVFWVINSNGS